MNCMPLTVASLSWLFCCALTAFVMESFIPKEKWTRFLLGYIGLCVFWVICHHVLKSTYPECASRLEVSFSDKISKEK